MQRLVFVGAGLLSLAAPGEAQDTQKCNVCMAASTELIKRTPILQRDAKEEDKQLAVGENFDNFCSTYNFGDYAEDTHAFAKVCKALVSEQNADGALQAKFVAGQPAAEICSTVCEGVLEGERLPKYVATPRPKAAAGKGSAAGRGKPVPKGKKGTVDDPAYKEALKRKAARDARRKTGAARPAAGEEGEAEGEEEL